MDLTDLAAQKSYLGLTVTTWDAILTTLVTQASRFIEKYCQRIFGTATYTEYYSGNNSCRLALRQYPVTSITSIHDDTDRDYAASSLISADDYTFDADSGIVYFDGTVLERGTKNVKVVYVAGYASVSAIPADLALACHKLVGAYFNRRKSDGQASDALGNVSYTYEMAMSGDVKALLQDWKKWVESS